MNGMNAPHHKSDPSLVQIPEDGELNDHMKAMWAGQSNVLVAVRVRPLMKHDIVKKSIVRVLDGKVVVILDPAANDKQDILRANRSREKQYAFDSVFDPSSSQDTVYHKTTKFLIHGVLDGFNATVFAYGQTGSGKTHTMIGSQADPGIMVRVMDDLFVHSKSQGSQLGVQYKVTVSFLEVYNENIRDLLSDVEEYLDLREDPIKGPVVASITEIEASTGQEIMQLLHQGNSKRSQAATAANEVSSRSHAVLQVVVECRDRAPGTVANIKVGKLSLVDLAGSERAANTKNVGQRLVEGANINRSLLALGNCINALGEKGNKGNFVPYRDSKLTRLLKDSLGGNCRTVMIANISCAESSFEETLNTLKYANRAKNIKTNVQRNVLNVNYHISEYVELINNLRSEIQVLKNQLGSAPVSIPDRVSTSSQYNRQSLDGHPVVVNTGIGATPSRALSPVVSNHHEPSTPMEALRESLKSGAGLANTAVGEQRELLNNMRQRIVDNFQERMQLRRSLIELEDQNVQNSIEVSKRQLIVVHWSEKHGNFLKKGDTTKADFAAYIMANGSPEVMEAWQECEQLRKAIIKNNGMKKNIAKRLRHNEKEAEHFRDELSEKVTGEDRRELMALQYQVGRLELENMELEQHRIVHESILKGKDLVIQKLRLQLAVKDKIINRQQAILKEHGLDHKVGYEQFALVEETLLGNESELLPPPSPPRNMSDIMSDFATSNNSMNVVPSSPEDSFGAGVVERRLTGSGQKRHRHRGGQKETKPQPQVPKLPINHQPIPEKSFSEDENVSKDQFLADFEDIPFTEREVALTSRDRDLIEQGDWSEIQSELSDQSFSFGHPEGSHHRSGGNRSHGHHNRHGKSNNNSNSNSDPSAPSVAAKGGVVSSSKLSSIKEPKGVHGPRGGRVYRSSASNNNNSSSNNQYNGNPQNNRPPPQQNHEEVSDEDSVNLRFQSKYRHYQSPRSNQQQHKSSGSGSLEKLEPILKEVDESSSGGIFSGRKLDKEIGHSASISPRENFAAVYPSSSNNNNNNSHSNSNSKRLSGENVPSDEKGGRRSHHRNNQNLNNFHAKINNMLLNQEDDSVELLDIKENNNLGFDNGLVIKSKPLGSKPILNKIKARGANNNNNSNISLENGAGVGGGNLSSLPSAASLANNPYPSYSENNAVNLSEGLNILGSGFENINNRPSNRLSKPSVRPIKAMLMRNNNAVVAAPSTETSSSNPNENNAPDLDSALQVGRMRSLPILNKQVSGNMPNSARDKN